MIDTSAEDRSRILCHFYVERSGAFMI